MRKLFLTGLFLFYFSSSLQAQNICPLNVKTAPPKEAEDLTRFEKMAVLHEGRIKPVDTYADNLLLQISGRKNFNKKTASFWLIRLLFAPQHALEDKIFLINNPDIPAALGIEPEKKRRYSYRQLEANVAKLQELALAADAIEPKERDVVEAELVRVFSNLRAFSELTFVFSFTFPHQDFQITDPTLRRELGFDEQKRQFSFIDIALKADKLQRLMGDFEKIPQNNWNASQREIVNVVTNLFHWTQSYQGLPFTIVPAYQPDNETFYTPWDAIGAGLHTQEAQKELRYLNELVIAYWQGDQLTFDMNAKLFNQSVRKRMEAKRKNALSHLSLEHKYNKWQLLLWAKILFLAGVFLFLFSLMRSSSWLYNSSWMINLSGLAALTVALIMRMIILKRPPVSNLYETFIFVGFISAVLGIIIERVNKQWLGLVITSISGFVFLTIAGKFSMEGDTLQMLVAVLNSNFWLGTHVLSITIGYAGVCVAGIVGHMYILQSIFKPKDKKRLTATYHILIGALGFGLTMTFLGTNLGGIWADQSWGRFWGWDPKENGALLIILWTALLFHAKVGKMIGPLGMAVGSVLGIIVVMWAWFGVNLLSIGLHSYGFTSGLARNLTIYVVLQLLFVAVSTPWAVRCKDK